MEIEKIKDKLPLIFINNIESESDIDRSMKSNTVEPEMEDFNDTMLLKNLIKELGIEGSLSTDIDPLKHDPYAVNTCVHCKLLKKVASLQSEITKMNQEICVTHEILNLKKEQNFDLKNMIKRLEGTLENNTPELALDKTASTCSCTNKCLIF